MPHQVSAPSKRGQAYELGEAPKLGPRSDLKLLERPPRWCPACGYDLTLVDTPPCPRCERPFVPGDPATTSREPVEVKHPYWTDRQRVAGYLLLPLFVLGRSIIAGVAPQWATMMAGGTGGSTASVFSAVTLGALIGLLIIPWFMGTALLGLVALGDYYNPKAIYCLMIGGGLGLFFALGMAPVMMFVGLFAGLFAGFLHAWLAKL